MTEHLSKTFPVIMTPSKEGTDITVDIGGGITLRATCAEAIIPNGEAKLIIPYKRTADAQP